MNSQNRQPIQPAQAVAIAQPQEGLSARFWFLTFAAFFAGVFYFYGFWYPSLWRALTES